MTIDRRTLMLAALGAGLAARGAAAPPTGPLLPEPDSWIDLWPGEAAGLPSPPPAEEMRERSTDPAYNDRAFFHIRRPRLAVFRPARPNGASLLIIPGGSYARVVVDKEGYESARWFAARGITAYVLFYRLAFDHWAAGAETSITDARRPEERSPSSAFPPAATSPAIWSPASRRTGGPMPPACSTR